MKRYGKASNVYCHCQLLLWVCWSLLFILSHSLIAILGCKLIHFYCGCIFQLIWVAPGMIIFSVIYNLCNYLRTLSLIYVLSIVWVCLLIEIFVSVVRHRIVQDVYKLRTIICIQERNIISRFSRNEWSG